MNKKSNFICIAIFSVLLFIRCEEQPVVIPDFVPVESDKVVLVEELTGVKCPNCPAGAARLAAIAELYPKNMIAVGIHGIDLASPLSESKYDFRNQDAADLEVFLKPFLGKPSAYFNRIRFEELLGDWGNPFNGQWQGYIERELEKPLRLNVFLSHAYDAEARRININVTTEGLERIDGELKITVMITESHIIDAQDDQFTIIEDYEHNHVLRDIITKFDGDFLANSISTGELIERDYTFTIPESDGTWVPENLEIVAFVAFTEGESEEVLQTSYANLVE